MNPGIIRTPEGVYVLKNDSHLSRWVEQLKCLDVAAGELAKFRKYIPTGGTVIDAGANIGDHTATYSQFVGSDGHVFSFEPNPIIFECLALNMQDRKNVTATNVGLSDCLTLGSMMVHDLNIGAGNFQANGSGNVVCKPLDSFAASMTRCDFIHLDVQGMELHAIKGGRELIAKFKPVIVCEVAQWLLACYGLTEADLIRHLDSIGYRWENAEPGYGPEYPQRDILCLPK